MSILKKPYTISVWDDVWNGERFVERCLLTIGSDTMAFQGRAFEPNLSTNVNGVKKLTFKLYKQYIDTITGKKVENPFYPWLISERKVKLQYKGETYDFIVKNIKENSSTHLCTYQLEDALVQELSKNGFNIVLDEKVDNGSNMGTAKELASRVLKETDWTVSNESEVLVETADEHLVYLTNIDKIKAVRIWDQKKMTKGVDYQENVFVEIPANSTLLAFYSSCTSKPYRFQFIYLENYDNLTTDENRIITNKDCQYFIDYFPENYKVINSQYDFYLPEAFGITYAEEDDVQNIVVSGKYRGKRYVFSQRSIFIPILNRYVNVYSNEDDKGNKNTYYGYQNTEYKSPALVQNIISNSDFKSTSGWTGTYNGIGTVEHKATVEAVYGYFANGKFVNALDELKNGSFSSEKTYEAYLQLTFPTTNSWVINSGPFDNRISIGNMELGDSWALESNYLSSSGQPVGTLNFNLGEYNYDPKSDGYVQNTTNIQFSNFQSQPNYSTTQFSTISKSNYSKESFKKNSKVRLRISATLPGTYYLKTISLFKASYHNGKLITPEEQANTLSDRTIETTYHYFSEGALANISSPDQLITINSKTLLYETYKPVFQTGAEKIRAVTAKESNYFNILQSIAETFGCWLQFKISRQSSGEIIKKEVLFKNYVGKDNYVGFRYGTNLKGIERTYESKKIVSKLIVKQNNNEFAKNGFCTIARAAANPTGENYIYDFQYFFNVGLMSARDFLDVVYVLDSPINNINDIDPNTLKGYYPKIKKLNNAIQEQSDVLINISRDLTQYKADLETAEAGYEAALAGLEQVHIDYERLTGQSITAISSTSTSDLFERTDVKKILTEYLTYDEQVKKYSKNKESYNEKVSALQLDYDSLSNNINRLLEIKQSLNQLFFKHYSCFIQEGTWTDEKYVDDEKYYADAQSVMYNSCYPQVGYTIDALEMSVLPGYEQFIFALGDKTYVKDEEFFGDEYRTEVIITELTEELDDPTKNKIKVQNFKNEFQDLFQKITATVQSTNYNSGSYEKAVALAEANQERKQQFFTDALDSATARLTTAGQQSVTWGNDGITVKSVNSPCDAIRMVGGAILLSKQDKNGEQKWVTGVTSDGVSASLITAGVINAGEISIMNFDEPVFRWDAFGITAFDAEWYDSEIGTTISGVDSKQFVRFDKFGIYGINGAKDTKDVKDGLAWHPKNIDEIHSAATFALTWDGLKVTGTEVETGTETKIKVVAHIGKQDDNIINITKGTSSIFKVTNSGDVTMTGTITATGGKIAGWLIDEDYGISSKDYTVGIVDPFAGVETFERPSLISNAGSKIVYYAGSFDPALSSNSKKIPEFAVLADGSLYASAAEIAGTITAKKGYIGGENGWVIDTNEISSTKNDTGSIVLSSASHSSDYWINATDKGKNTKFSVQKGGKLFARDADIAGRITATEGEIAGWTISQILSGTEVKLAGLTYGTLGDSDGFHMYAVNSSEEKLFGATESQSWALGIGTSFGVTKAGSLYATGANITGKITATGGTIGNWNIGTSHIGSVANQGYFYLYSAGSTSNYWISCYKKNDTSSSYKKVFSITKTGQLYSSDAEITGKITANAGSIIAGWETTENVFGKLTTTEVTNPQHFYNGAAITSPKYYYGMGMSANPVDYQNNNRVFAIGALTGLDGSWSQANFQVKADGSLYAKNANITGKITATEGFIGPLKITEQGIGVEGDGSYVFISGEKIRTPKGDIGGWQFDAYSVQSFYQILPTGAIIYGGSSASGYTNYYVKFLPDKLVTFEKTGTANYTQYIEWDSLTTINLTSDARFKNSIEDMPDEYDTFFDMLQPKRYKYNDGTSDRYHTGYIAQEVVQSLGDAGLNTSDFAAVMLRHPGTTSEKWQLRKDEFVALNTWQIQKLKPRMTAAEKEIASLKLEVQQLREELAVLKQ